MALLALLAAAPTGAVSRDKLIAYLWPELDSDRARHLLADAVYKLRKELGRDAVLAAGDDLLWNAEAISADVREFRLALERGDREAAIDLYRGPFLDGLYLDDAPELERWVEDERARLARAYARALEEVAEARESGGDLRGAVEAWARLASHDPYASRVALGLMRALAASGDRAGALRHAQAHTARLRDELGIEPDREMTELVERLRATSATSRPATAARPAPADTSAQSGARPRERFAGSQAPRRRSVQITVAFAGALALTAILLPSSWRDRVLGRTATPAVRAIAVLPLEDLSPGGEEPYLADGMTDALITDLARISRVPVISRTSVLPYGAGSQKPLAQIARDLSVDAVVEGTVLRTGDRVRVSVRLTHAATERLLWAESYERELRDVLALQGELAQAIARGLDVRVAPRVRPEPAPPRAIDPGAYESYLKGRYAWNRRTEDGLQRAIGFFQAAIEREPGYARAYAGLGDSYAILAAGYARVAPRDLYAMAIAAAQRALELDPTHAEAHATLGFVRGLHDWDWAAAERAFRRAIELNPSYATAHQWYALLLGGWGRTEEALTHLRHAERLDPLSPAIGTDIGRLLYYERRYDEAIDELRKTLALDPSFARAHGVLGAAYLETGRVDEAIEEHGRAIELAGGWLQQRWGLPGLAYAYAAAGRRDEALLALEELLAERRTRYERPESIAVVYLGLGDRASALAWLERAAEERSIYPLQLRDAVYNPMRSDPRFRRILERMGLD